MAPDKELRYFDRHYDRGIEWYRAQFRKVSGEQAIGEASPGYMYFGAAIERIAATLPHARLIAILRNPVERAYSHYWVNRALGLEELQFEEAVSKETERLATGYSADVVSYVDRGRYVVQLQRVCDWMPREGFLVLLFEDLRSEPVETYQRVCRFLDVDDACVPRDLITPVNRFVTFRSQDLRRLALHLPSLPRRVIERVNTRRSQPYPPMKARTRMALADMFREPNAALAAWLGRDLSVWEP